MTVQNQQARVEELTAEMASEGEAGGADAAWVKANLRLKNGEPINDIANALRIFENHADYKGRFKYNEMVNRVLDKGTVMIDWRIYELCAGVQERFMPGVAEEVVVKALTVAANKTGVLK